MDEVDGPKAQELLRKLARAGIHTPGCVAIISWGDAGCDCGADNEMHRLTEEVRTLVGDLRDDEHDFRRAISECDPCKQGAIPVLTKRAVTWDDKGETKSGEVDEWIHPGVPYPDDEQDKERGGAYCFAHQFHEARIAAAKKGVADG